MIDISYHMAMFVDQGECSGDVSPDMAKKTEVHFWKRIGAAFGAVQFMHVAARSQPGHQEAADAVLSVDEKVLRPRRNAEKALTARCNHRLEFRRLSQVGVRDVDLRDFISTLVNGEHVAFATSAQQLAEPDQMPSVKSS